VSRLLDNSVNKRAPETCPGIQKFIRPVPEYFKCPFCGGKVEIWSDEDSGTCESCGKEVKRPSKEASCLEWCQYADKCKEIIKQRREKTKHEHFQENYKFAKI
jgi:hypothetical protein